MYLYFMDSTEMKMELINILQTKQNSKKEADEQQREDVIPKIKLCVAFREILALIIKTQHIAVCEININK